MTRQEQERAAERFISALRELASKKENICNFESYLISHFSEWLRRYATSPENSPQSLNNSQKWSFNNRAARRGGSIFRRLTQCQSNG